MKKEYKKIIIHEFPWGPDTNYNLELNDVTIKIYNYFIEIKSKGLHKKHKEIIDENTFNKLYNDINNLNYDKLYSENDSGFDGWELELEISRKRNFMKLKKRVEIFSPYIEENKKETNKLLLLIEEIKNISKYDEYYKEIEKHKEKYE